MKQAIWLLLGLVLSGSAGAAPDGSRANALALVKRVHLDELMAHIANARAKRAFDAGKLDAAQFKCTATFEPAQFTDDFVTMAQAVLSAKELDAALDFYRTEAGQALMAHELAGIESKHNFTGKSAPELPPMTADQNEEVEAFGRTHTGRRLIETGVLMLTPETQSIYDEHMRAAAKRCAAATGKQR